MSEPRDPAIKLFGKTIPVAESPATRGGAPEASSSSSTTVLVEDNSNITIHDNANNSLSTDQDEGNSNKDVDEDDRDDGGPGDDGSGDDNINDENSEKDIIGETTTEAKEQDGDQSVSSDELRNSDSASGAPENPKTSSVEDDASPKVSKTEDERSDGTDSQEKTLKKPDKILPCPRCNSMDTKFCYYNNYNLSQPRHFCKSCRRYWTKGGVLRNVPVGGGCRKTKRSKQKANSAAAPAEEERMKTTTNSHSSSESSSLTATNTTAEAASAPPSNPEPKLAEPPAAAANSVLEGGSSDCGLFSEIGSLANLMAANSGGGDGSALPFEFGSISQFRLNQSLISQSWNMQKDVNPGRENDQLKAQESLMIDQTAQVDLSVLQQERSNGGGFGSLGDWQQCGDQGLFDLTNNVDQQYWSQNQWSDQDNANLYLP